MFLARQFIFSLIAILMLQSSFGETARDLREIEAQDPTALWLHAAPAEVAFTCRLSVEKITAAPAKNQIDALGYRLYPSTEDTLSYLEGAVHAGFWLPETSSSTATGSLIGLSIRLNI